MDQQQRGLISVMVTPGEILDRITILRIKCERLGPTEQRRVCAALARTEEAWVRAGMADSTVTGLAEALSSVNQLLWDAEDRARECERRRDFGERFVACAREIIRLNDQRASLKQRVNACLGLATAEEEKVYSSRW